MTDTHTAGPWTLDGPRTANLTKEGDNYHVIEAGNEIAGQSPGVTGFRITTFMPIADARLIKAAPALLAAAKIVAADESCRSHTYRHLWAAIKLAETGE